MPHFFLPKTRAGTLNVSVVRENGDRLSFAADDSCGTSKYHYIRTYLLTMDSNGKELSTEQTRISPEEYLTALADFLGYDIIARKE